MKGGRNIPATPPKSDKFVKPQNDLATHKIMDEMEKIDIENYLNRGGAGEHPKHRIDPEVEKERVTGNFKFKVCPPERQRQDAVCVDCINKDQIT